MEFAENSRNLRGNASENTETQKEILRNGASKMNITENKIAIQ